MPDYKRMYTELFCATEQAIDILITAQRRCEELYLKETENPIKLAAASEDDKE